MNDFTGKTCAEALDILVAKYGDNLALVSGEDRYSFTDVLQKVDEAARRLLALGLRKGDKIALWMTNRPEFMFTWLGANKIGIVAVFINTRLSADEVCYQLEQSDSRIVLVPGDGAFRDFLSDIARLKGSGKLADIEHVIALDATEHALPGLLTWPDIPADTDTPLPLETDYLAPAVIAYSSGTTALPKGAMLSHVIWRKAADHGARFFQTPEDKLYLCVPMFSILSTVNGVLTFWVGGSSVVLDDRFEPEKMLSTLERERCTAVYLLPPMVYRSVELDGFDRYDLSSIRTGILVSTSDEDFRIAHDKLNLKGFVTSYGMTETSSACTRTWADEPLEDRLRSHGKPLPDIEVRIANPDTDTALPPGEEGEIQVRGYNVMLGYYKKPEATERAFSRDGWYKTGDLGDASKDGAIRFLRRLSDGYKHKGFNVSAPEVEAAIEQHPGVKRAVVCGVPDGPNGECGVAFVKREAGAHVTAQEILDALSAHLASFKRPARVHFVDTFPTTAGTEKVQKFKLREMDLALNKAAPLTTETGA